MPNRYVESIMEKCHREGCKNKVRRTPYDLRAGKNIYCSCSCKAQQMHTNRGETGKQVKCGRPECDNTMKQFPSDVRNGKAKYCSKSCAMKHRQSLSPVNKGKMERADLEKAIAKDYVRHTYKQIAEKLGYHEHHIQRIAVAMRTAGTLPEKHRKEKPVKVKRQKKIPAPKPPKVVKEKVYHETMKRAPKAPVQQLPNRVINNSEYVWVQIDSRTRVQRRIAS